MAYNEDLAHRIRRILAGRPRLTEQKMFGGVAFMIGGHMACGPWGEDLIIRIGEEAAQKAIGLPHVRPMAITGKPLRPFAYVEAAGIRTGPQLRKWVEMSVEYAGSLPPKAPKPGAAPKKKIARISTARPSKSAASAPTGKAPSGTSPAKKPAARGPSSKKAAAKKPPPTKRR